MGVYKITNLTDGKSYIGQSGSIKTRKRQHFTKLKNNRHKNPYLQNAYNIDKEENFIHELVTEVIVPEKLDYDNIILKHYLCLAEEHNIEWFKSRITENGYNIREVSESNIGTPINVGKNNPMWGTTQTKESNLKRSIANSGKNNPNYGKIGSLSYSYGHIGTMPGKELFLHFPNGKHYFITNSRKFGKEFNLDNGHLAQLATGYLKSYKGITGERAPQWLVDKVKPLMKPGQYWIEIDINGNIIT